MVSPTWIGRFDDLRRDYELETIQLPESYRCPPEIVDRANRFIRHTRRLIASRKTVAVREARGGRTRTSTGKRPKQPAGAARCRRAPRAGLEGFVPQRKTEFALPVPSVLAEALWRALHRKIVGEYGRGVILNAYLSGWICRRRLRRPHPTRSSASPCTARRGSDSGTPTRSGWPRRCLGAPEGVAEQGGGGRRDSNSSRRLDRGWGV